MSFISQEVKDNRIDFEASYQLLLATLDAAVDGVIVIGQKGNVRLFSQGAERMFGYSSAEVVGENVSLLMPESLGRSHNEKIRHYIETGEGKALGFARRVLAQCKKGEVFSIHLSLGEFQSDEGRMFVGIARDLRTRSQLKSELDREQQKSRRLLQKLHEVHQAGMFNELVSRMSHEINQPLTAITAYADVTRRFLLEDLDEPVFLKGNLEKISIQALRASNVIKKIRKLKPRSVLTGDTSHLGDLMGEIEDVIEVESGVAGCTVRWRLEDGLPPVRAEASHIQHVLIVLLRISYGSFLHDATTRVVTVSATKLPDHFVQITVENNCKSVDDAGSDTLYHYFSTNKADETDLNLSVCNTIIVNHGGRIWHESVAGRGSRYIFTLPVNSQRNTHDA